MERLGETEQVISLSQEVFYRELSVHDIARARKGMFNFDHPDAFDIPLMESCLQVGPAGGRSSKSEK